jgi:hypothetical protein
MRCQDVVGRPAASTSARVPDHIAFATKPTLAAQMIGAALDAGVPASWVGRRRGLTAPTRDLPHVP